MRWAVLHVDLEPIIGHEQGGARRALVVSYEPVHRSGRATICPITAAREKATYPNEVEIPVGEGGQTKAGVILCHQMRTISLLRVSPSGRVAYVTSALIRSQVRMALTHHLGLDIPNASDGALTG
ncbi:MAG: type II toxin-antitoxin system PemK/MazF family toxin [Chloroflexota bacterium]